MTSTQQFDELKRRIWQIANDVRGTVDGWDFKQYVLGALFYRFISENFSRYIEGGDKNVGIIYPSDGAFMAPEALGIVNGCPHPAEAKKFVDYLLSKKVVDEIFAKFSRRPARPDATEVAGLPAVNKIPLLKSYDTMEANALEKEILKKWKEIVLSR